MHTLLDQLLAMGQPVLPSIIAPAARPFDVQEPRHLSVHDALRVRQVLLTTQRALRTGQPANPATLHLLAEHIVGLHKQLLEGTAKVTREARVVLPQRALMQLLEDTYDLLEPLAA